jgi:hypothetical protein
MDASMRDFIFKPALDAKGDVDRTWLKKELAGLLGDRVVDGETRYVFSAEPLIAEAGAWYRLRISSDGPAPPGMREIPVAGIDEGDEAVFSAWVALGGDMFRPREPRGLLATRCRDKLLSYAATRFGEAMDVASVEVGKTIRVMSAESKGARLSRPYGRVTVAGVVRDREKIDRISMFGIGEAKAYGFGLVAA